MGYAVKRTRLYLRHTSEPLEDMGVELRLTARERQRLVLEAKARGLTPNALCRVLIERIIHGGLVRMVLNCTAGEPAFNERTFYGQRQEDRRG